MSPFRGDVVLVAFLLAIPVFLLALRGSFTLDDVISRLPWCLGAGWAAVALVRWASTPPPPKKRAKGDPAVGTEPETEAAPTA